MRHVLSVIVLSVLLFGRLGAEDAPVETWVIAGQSNSCGHAEFPGPDPDPRVKMWSGRKLVEAKEPLENMNGQVGPWLYAALDVAKGGVPLNLTGWSMGAQSITYWDDNATGYGWLAGNGTGLSTSIKQCTNAGVFLWYQGETDGLHTMTEADYKTKLIDLVKRVRTLAKNPKMMVVVVQLGPSTIGGDFMPIREAQRRFVIEDGNALLVPALGLNVTDGVHLDKAGYKQLGQEVARALLKNRYGKKDVNWPGPVMDVAVPGADGKTAAVHFAEVKKLGGVKAEDFGAVDATGPVKCIKAEAGNTMVALTFERVLKPPAKVIYGNGQNPGSTLVDEAGNRAPAVQLDLKAGVVPPDKETAVPNGAGVKVSVGK